jgi:hypothetical protein
MEKGSFVECIGNISLGFDKLKIIKPQINRIYQVRNIRYSGGILRGIVLEEIVNQESLIDGVMMEPYFPPDKFKIAKLGTNSWLKEQLYGLQLHKTK